MIYHLYCSRSIKSGIYQQPYAAVEDIAHTTDIWDRLASAGRITEFMSGLELFHLGTFDDVRGRITLDDDPIFILAGHDYFALSEKVKANLPTEEETGEKDG